MKIKGVNLSGFSKLILLGGALLILVLWAFTLKQVEDEYASQLNDTSRETVNLTRVFAEHVQNVLDHADEDLLMLKQYYETEGRNSPVITGFFNSRKKRPQLNQVSIIDEQGMLVTSLLEVTGRNDFSDRDFFKFHQSSSAEGLNIDKPIVGRLSGEASIPLTRRINKPDGSFGGIVYLGVSSRYFTNFYRTMELGKEKRIAVTGLDGFVRARQIGEDVTAGQNVVHGDVFKRAQLQPLGVLISRDAVDGIRRIQAYRVLPEYPLYVIVATGYDEAMAGVDARKRGYLLTAVLLSLFIASLCVLLVRQQEAQKTALEVLEQKVGDRTRELQTLNEELDQRVSDRTERLAYAVAKLERANRDLESFSYTIAHDLRSPLRAINSFGEILTEDCSAALDDECRDMLARMCSESHRMGVLIDALLSINKISSDGMQLENCDLSAIASELAAQLKREQPERDGVSFVIQPGVTARANSALMQNLLNNLLRNSWKYTSKHPTARIEFGVTEKGGLPVYYVRDDGAGFDMAYSAKLFKIFERLHNEAEFPGYGIGLASAERIVKRHGGSIWAEGAVEKGATIYFTLQDEPPEADT